MSAIFLRTVRVSPDLNAPIEAKLRATVGNVGNMLFETALKNQLSNDVEEIWRVQDIPEDLDLLILSMSNFISPATDLKVFADEIEKKKVNKIVMVGCGAQAYDANEQIDLKPGTKRFVDLLSERSKSVGVRGVYTAQVLEKMGYKNTDIVGCPSVYWPGIKGWPQLEPRAKFESRKYGIHCTPSGKYRDAVKSLLRFGMKNRCYYLCQSEISYLDRENIHRDFTYYLGTTEEASECHAHFGEFGKIFFELQDWVDFNSTLDFVVGSRFHGNVVTMLAGRPSLSLVFDTRTKELSDHYSLPYIHFEDFDGDKPVEYYMEKTDYSTFYGTYPTRLLEYCDFLEKNDVPHNIYDPMKADISAEIMLNNYSEKTANSIMRNAILTGYDKDRFQSQLSLRTYLGRSKEARDLVESRN